MKRLWQKKAHRQIFTSLLLASSVSVALLLVRLLLSSSNRYLFLLWNLFLAWIPLVLAYWFNSRKSEYKIINWQDLLLLGVWLLFLPNTFYIITDLVHLHSSNDVGLLYDTVLLVSFAINGLVLGYTSLSLVQQKIGRYTSSQAAYIFAHSVLLLSSFAIYLGRYMRWNSWDIIINPAGLIFDVSDRLINPDVHLPTYVITAVFYVFLGSFYAILCRLSRLVRIVPR